jgi:hypothetical protein
LRGRRAASSGDLSAAIAVKRAFVTVGLSAKSEAPQRDALVDQRVAGVGDD